MKTNKTKSTENSTVAKLAILGASLAGLAATSYFFIGKNAKKHQKHAKAWAIKMKGDVVEKLEQAREVSESVYKEIVDSVASEYEKGMKASKDEISTLADDLKKHWKSISKSPKFIKDTVVKSVKQAVKKVRSNK